MVLFAGRRQFFVYRVCKGVMDDGTLNLWYALMDTKQRITQRGVHWSTLPPSSACRIHAPFWKNSTWQWNRLFGESRFEWIFAMGGAWEAAAAALHLCGHDLRGPPRPRGPHEGEGRHPGEHQLEGARDGMGRFGGWGWVVGWHKVIYGRKWCEKVRSWWIVEVLIASELRVEGILGCGRRSGDGNCEIMKPQTLNIIYPCEASHVPWESNEISAMNYYYDQSYIYI